ncbi:unnamed protein product [Caenorhabditis auriculariae]|uniref:Superoxide dismutase [Cu-Zn] n=1 Tax=Caenorhabditis auriculariae TaxID=2777116 RepID=A0A8S1H4W7_9PELO|nr:unnamed protein product [Caenorhabditis auriculariae]
MSDLRHVFAFSLIAVALATSEVIRGRAYIFKAVPNGLPSQIVGSIDFEQTGSFLKLNGSILGLAPGQHGFHIHEKGDIGNGCLAAGAHYNPHKLTHGAPDDSNRHVGDLGNIETPPDGFTPISVSDSLASLTGPYSIVGRSVVVHEKIDDLGRGTSDLSKTTGDAGGRLACGIIGAVEEVTVEATTAGLPPLPLELPQGSGASKLASCLIFAPVLLRNFL